MTFEVGDRVYLKLQPYKQLSTEMTKDHKLSKRFYGPFKILEQISPMAYRLDLPASSEIHPAFHNFYSNLVEGKF